MLICPPLYLADDESLFSDTIPHKKKQ